MKATSGDVLFLIMAGVVLAIAIYLAPRQGQAGQVASPSDIDNWDVPYYLRYNVSLARPGAVVPLPPAATYSLGVPGSTTAARTLVIQQ